MAIEITNNSEVGKETHPHAPPTGHIRRPFCPLQESGIAERTSLEAVTAGARPGTSAATICHTFAGIFSHMQSSLRICLFLSAQSFIVEKCPRPAHVAILDFRRHVPHTLHNQPIAGPGEPSPFNVLDLLHNYCRLASEGMNMFLDRHLADTCFAVVPDPAYEYVPPRGIVCLALPGFASAERLFVFDRILFHRRTVCRLVHKRLDGMYRQSQPFQRLRIRRHGETAHRRTGMDKHDIVALTYVEAPPVRQFFNLPVRLCQHKIRQYGRERPALGADPCVPRIRLRRIHRQIHL